MCWRDKVFARAEGFCQFCKGGRTPGHEAHHIYPKADWPELRNDLANGILLCRPCHEATHRIGALAFVDFFLHITGNQRLRDVIVPRLLANRKVKHESNTQNAR